MASPTRDRIIQTAHDLFYREGFRAVGLDRIISEVGVTKTTFYNHFESKDDLALEVLRLHDRWWCDTFRTLLRKHGGDTPRGQLLAIADAVHDTIDNNDFNGCIFINVAVEYPQQHDPAHEAAAAHKRSMEEIITEIAGYAGAADPTGLAKQLSLVLEGAYVTQHVTHDSSTATIARSLITMLIDAKIPQTTAASPRPS